MKYSYDKLRPEYERLWQTMEIHPDKRKVVDAVARRILANKDRYVEVEAATTVPWFVIGILHTMECGGNFRLHLHNGDPLYRKTVRVPQGRPPGNPPWTWEESAIDALKLKNLHTITDWCPARLAWVLELFNGFGYRNKGLPSPYLWSYSQHYSKGKYVADGQFSPTAVSTQAGGMVLFKALMDLSPDVRFGNKEDVAKPLYKSKIAAAASAAGAAGAGISLDDIRQAKKAADDLGLIDLILQRRFLIVGLILVVLAAFIVYWRWKDHGRGNSGMAG
jgi:lysozyme family protein